MPNFCLILFTVLQVVANFGASWCNPSKSIAPAYSELAAKHPSILFLTLDVDDLAVSIEKCYRNLPSVFLSECNSGMVHKQFLDE